MTRFFYAFLCVCLCSFTRLSTCMFLCFPQLTNCLCLPSYHCLCLPVSVSPSHSHSHTPFSQSHSAPPFIISWPTWHSYYPSTHMPFPFSTLYKLLQSLSLSLFSVHPFTFPMLLIPFFLHTRIIPNNPYSFFDLSFRPPSFHCLPSPSPSFSAIRPASCLHPTSLPSSILWPILHYLPY